MMQTNTLNIVLNGSIVQGYSGETILSLARRNGIEIPTMCHDDRLEPFSSCFVCVVEVEGMRGHQPSCSTLLTEGMKIITDSEGIRKSRKMALELMLSNHYADCLGPCKQTCPAGVDVQGYISLIDKGLYHDAVGLIKETNPLPAICGRVCVRPCEAACRRNLLDEGTPVGIDYMKRFAADIDLESPNKFRPHIKPPTGKKIAVIGAGPGGLSAAHFLAIEGHHVEIYEAAPKSGGWLRYGIPEYRLPNDILDKEVENITDLGVEIHYNQKLGENLYYKDLAEHYDAVVLTIGSQKGTGVGCDGDDAVNVFSGIDFLKNMEITGQRYDFRGKTIAVVGGGNTAMDCCRTSMRCNADKVYVIYRRTEKEMPANPIEIHESKLEGVEYMFLTLPKKINKNAGGEVESVTCTRMELGEPDASGRRRPVPVEGSDFDIKVDYILAAIGQKTDVGFLEDINKHCSQGELKINRWGDIDADRDTLQTGIPSVFAAGDGVTGPATIIEAIAQAKKASLSAHQYVMGLPVKPAGKPFTSRKDNLKTQEKSDYLGRFNLQKREEMPTLPSSARNNFREVELGYPDETVAGKEAQRCLECGCTAFFNCDLQKYATEYQANQNSFEGEFIEYQVDFRHPLIEIDNNKCILCARCIRICREVVGANALGLVNRGLKTYVAPGMGSSLHDSSCESCGLCISTCPTGAITENVPFKPGPVIAEKYQSICNYCSVGCTIEIQHKGNFITGVNGRKGVVNSDGNICRLPKFGYRNRNSIQRITKPLLKENGIYSEISFERAFEIIVQKIRSVEPAENAFFGGARLTNEELYLIHKLARGGARTNNIGSFQYLARGEGYRQNTRLNVPFSQIPEASAYFIFGSEMSQDHPVISYMVQNRHYTAKTPVYVISTDHLLAQSKVDEQIRVSSYYHFIKAVNFYLLNNGLENQLFIKDRTTGFEEYRKAVLDDDFPRLVSASGTTEDVIAHFAVLFNTGINAVLIFSEKNISANTSKEIRNLAMITGKLGKTANGIIALRESCNSQGVFDMGISPHYGIGGQSLTEEQYLKKLVDRWGFVQAPPYPADCLWSTLTEGSLKNLFIFGEDPLGCAMDKDFMERTLAGRDFLMVQDYFLTETASLADLVLPASFPDEIGGTFTNAQKTIQEFQQGRIREPEMNSLNQIAMLVKHLGLISSSDPNQIFMEIVPLLPEFRQDEPEKWVITTGDNDNRNFYFGCDAWTKLFAETLAQPLK